MALFSSYLCSSEHLLNYINWSGPFQQRSFREPVALATLIHFSNQKFSEPSIIEHLIKNLGFFSFIETVIEKNHITVVFLSKKFPQTLFVGVLLYIYDGFSFWFKRHDSLFVFCVIRMLLKPSAIFIFCLPPIRGNCHFEYFVLVASWLWLILNYQGSNVIQFHRLILVEKNL